MIPKKKLRNYIFKNKFLILLIIVYTLITSSSIIWGIPNPSHPFPYHMDEWHFLNSVHAVIKHGTTTIPGAGHIPFFHVLSTIAFLAPFILFGIIHPFVLHASVENLDLWQKLFEVLRLHTMFYGILCLIGMYFLLKSYCKRNVIIPLLLFTFTPMFLMYSGYYKYDITLLFWIVLSLYFSIQFLKTSQNRYFYFSSAAVGLAMATKFSALPLICSLAILFLLQNKKNTRSLRVFFIGMSIFIAIFLLLGVPDLLIGTGNYFELLDSNLVQTPAESSYLLVPYSVYIFLLKDIYPILFGHGFYLLGTFSILYSASWLLLHIKKSNDLRYRMKLFIFLTCMLFASSLIILKIYASGNRVLVMLPFFVLISTDTIYEISSKIKKFRILLIIFLLLFMCLQIFESFLWVNNKINTDVRNTSSIWVVKHISPKTLIGLENIPIYQEIPNIFLKEFYTKQSHTNFKTRYTYEVINSKQKVLPPVVVITNKEEIYLLSNSSKKELIERLNKEQYHLVAYFNPWEDISILGEAKNIVHAGLIPTASIAIYAKSMNLIVK